MELSLGQKPMTEEALGRAGSKGRVGLDRAKGDRHVAHRPGSCMPLWKGFQMSPLDTPPRSGG